MVTSLGLAQKHPALAAFVLLPALLTPAGGCSRDRAGRADSRAAPQSGKVRLATVPPGAAVLVDGRTRVGKTPLTLRREGGTRLSVLMVKDGYRPKQRTVLVAGGSTLRVLTSLEPLTGHVIVSTGPLRGADLLVDGQRRGRTPQKLKLTPGEHAITVQKASFDAVTRRVRVVARQTVRIDIPLMLQHATLVKKVAWVSLETDVPADVYEDKRLLGSTPLERVAMTPGRHTLTVRAVDPSREKSVEVRLRRRRHKKLKVSLK